MRTEILIRDINEIEEVMEQTANIPGHRAVAPGADNSTAHRDKRW